MPSSLTRYAKAKSVRVLLDALRGQMFAIAPDLLVPSGPFAAADLTGANSGFWVLIAPAPMVFLGVEHIHTVAGTNNYRVKKVLSTINGAPGAAADANNIDISGTIALAAAANTIITGSPVLTNGAYRIAQGDKIAIASSAGTASLAGARAVLRFAFV